jgi:DNA-binding response OmpR family regulator
MAIKVLLVDDDPEILKSAREYLIRRGFEIRCSETGLGVTPMIRETRPDVVVIDVMMPMLGGPTLAGYLQQLQAMRDIPILFYSAMDEEKLHHLSREAGIRYVSKADGLGALYDAIISVTRSE